MTKKKVTIAGAGSIGTALGHALAKKKEYDVQLLSIEEDVVKSINENRRNFKYFPNVKLGKFLKATTDNNVMKDSDIIFLALPSLATTNFVLDNKNIINDSAILLNMAKGFSKDQQTITEALSSKIKNPVCAFKGPTFARELINKFPTAFTIGTTDPSHEKIFNDLFQDTAVHIDYSTDVNGVEILSILKNIYAIATGIVDAHYDSPNLRFLFLTKAFNEMKNILVEHGGLTETMFKYCGYGDFTLTALNDLSRNRTLGLLIGKGFFTDDISEHVILEGKIAISVFCEEITSKGKNGSHYPIISELYKVFNRDYDISKFVSKVVNS